MAYLSWRWVNIWFHKHKYFLPLAIVGSFVRKRSRYTRVVSNVDTWTFEQRTRCKIKFSRDSSGTGSSSVDSFGTSFFDKFWSVDFSLTGVCGGVGSGKGLEGELEDGESSTSPSIRITLAAWRATYSIISMDTRLWTRARRSGLCSERGKSEAGWRRWGSCSAMVQKWRWVGRMCYEAEAMKCCVLLLQITPSRDV